MKETIAQLGSQLRELMSEVKAARADVAANSKKIDAQRDELREEIRELREELREEIKELRGDVAFMSIAHAGDIDSNKKKLPVLPNGFRRNWSSPFIGS